MKKRWLAAVMVVVVVGAAIFLRQHKPVRNTVAPAPSARFALTDAEISAAINYGKSHQDDFLVDFEKPWVVFLGYGSGKGSATVFTPYHCLALMVRNSARDNFDTDTKVLRRLCAEKHQDPYFEVILYGDDDGFDRDYKAVILKGDREIPVIKSFHQGYDQAREYTIAGRQKIYFPADILSDKAKIILRIARPEKAPLDFVFDLEKVQ